MTGPLLGRLGRLAHPVVLAAVAYAVLAALWTDLPARWDDGIHHDRNEDWDWQLTFYEACRVTLLRFGQVPVWTPYTQGGVPMLANPESPFLYPGFALVLALGTETGMRVFVWAHLVLAATGVFALASRSGVRPLLALGAPLPWLGTAFLAGFLAYGHVMYLAVAWIPWMLIAAAPWPGASARGPALAALALSLTWIMGGHYVFLYGLLLLGLASGWRLLGSGAARVLVLCWLAVDVGLAGLRHPPFEPALWGVLVAFLLAVPALAPGGAPPWSGLIVDEARRTLAVAVPAVLLISIKLVTGTVLLGQAERLTDVPFPSAADAYDLPRLLAVWTGSAPRPSGHEGHDVFHAPLPLVLAALGAVLGGGPGRAFAAGALVFVGLALSDNLPADFSRLLHALPGFGLFRVTERYALVYSMMIGLAGACALEGAARLASRFRPAPRFAVGLVVVASIAGWAGYGRTLWSAERENAALAGRRARPDLAFDPTFLQARGSGTNYDSVRANRGRVDCWTTAWLDEPAAGLRAASDPGYRGEVYAVGEGAVTGVRVTPSRIEARVSAPGPVTLVVNQNAFPGWRARTGTGAPLPLEVHDGLLAARVPPGGHDVTFSYTPPGMVPGVAGSVLGLGWVTWRLARGRRP